MLTYRWTTASTASPINRLLNKVVWRTFLHTSLDIFNFCFSQLASMLKCPLCHTIFFKHNCCSGLNDGMEWSLLRFKIAVLKTASLTYSMITASRMSTRIINTGEISGREGFGREFPFATQETLLPFFAQWKLQLLMSFPPEVKCEVTTFTRILLLGKQDWLASYNKSICC